MKTRRDGLILSHLESHGQRSLVGYSPQGHKSQTQLKQLSMHACKSFLGRQPAHCIQAATVNN